MDNLWAWFKRANAKAVLAAAVVVLLAAIAWWTWKTLTPLAFAPPALPPASSAKPPPPLGLLAFIEQEGAVKMKPTDPSLFVLPAFLKPKPPEVTNPDVRGVDVPTPPQPPKPVPTPVPTPTPTPAATPKRDVLSILYRGLYQRSDGGVMALIEDSKSHSASYYPAGTNVFGLTVSNVAPEELTVTTPDGETSLLKRGEAALFTDGKRE